MEMRTRRLFPPPLTSTSTISIPSDSATLRAISSIFDVTGDCIVPDVPEPTKKWAFAHWVNSTSNHSVAPGCKGRVVRLGVKIWGSEYLQCLRLRGRDLGWTARAPGSYDRWAAGGALG